MNWKQFLHEYFAFTRRERIGLLVIIVVILFIWILPSLVHRSRVNSTTVDTGWIAAAKKLLGPVKEPLRPTDSDEKETNEPAYSRRVDKESAASKTELFAFDPNILSPEGWRKLGLRDKTITTIERYLDKGGHFYKTEDLRKIYGIRADEYLRLEPFVQIVQSTQGEKTKFRTESRNETGNAPRLELVEINSADTNAFIALPGIGNKLAFRIVNFREKLGGFYSVNQVGEVYGLADSTFQKIKGLLQLSKAGVKQLDINKATKEELRAHPYIKWNLANAIVEHRNQHGNYSSLDDLRQIPVITDEIFKKVKPYLAL